MARKDELDALDAIIGDDDLSSVRRRAQTSAPSQFNPMLVAESAAKAIDGLYLLPVDQLVPFQSKGDGDFTPYSDDEIKDMAEKMDKDGSYEPIIVRQMDSGKFEILAGEQRWRASKYKGLTHIKAIVNRNCSDARAKDIFLLTNLQHRKNRISDQIYGWKQFYDNHPSVRSKEAIENATNITELAHEGKLQISLTQYYRYVNMANLIHEMIAALDNQKIALRTGYEISSLSHPEQRLLLPYLNLLTEEKVQMLKKQCSPGQELTKEMIEDFLFSRKPAQPSYNNSLRRDMTNIKKLVIQNINPAYYGRVDEIVRGALLEYLEKNPEYAITDPPTQENTN